MNAGRVLVVDDEREMCALLEAGLGKRGFEIVSRPSGDSALGLLDEEDFDAIVADLNMPGTSGLDLAAWVAANRADTPVVVITAFGSLETAVAAIRAGAYHQFDPRSRRGLPAAACRIAEATPSDGGQRPPARRELAGYGARRA